MWPSFREPQADPVHLSAEDLERIHRITYAVRRWESNESVEKHKEQGSVAAALAGVRIEDGFAIATDNYRGARVTLSSPIEVGVTVPLATISAVTKAIPAEGVDLVADALHVRFEGGGVRWTSTLIAGAFPRTEHLFAFELPRRLIFARDALLAALARSQLVSAGNSNLFVIDVDADKGMATIRNAGLDVGSSVEVLACQGDFSGRACLNAAYVTQMVRACHGDELVFRCLDASKPFRLDDDGVAHMLGPVAVPPHLAVAQ